MSKRTSQPAAPANTIVTTVFLQFRCVVSVGELIGASHPLGDFEHEPAECGETDPPEKHHSDHHLPLLFTG
jgi:hypothetical protein